MVQPQAFVENQGCQTAFKVDPRNGVRPLGWTLSGGGFDLLSGVLILEGCGAEIAQG